MAWREAFGPDSPARRAFAMQPPAEPATPSDYDDDFRCSLTFSSSRHDDADRNKGLQIGVGFATFALMQRTHMPQSNNVQFFNVPSIMEDTMKAFPFIRRSAIFVGAGLLLVSGSCSTPSGAPEEGQRWYSMHNCYACHGRQGNDGKAPEIYPLDMSYRHFLGVVRDAGSPIMPKYSEEKIPDGDVADIYAWLTRK